MKSCFVISPIGEEGSETRNRANKVLKHVIRPAALTCGYEAQRADEIDKPGLITSQVIERVISDDLIIADLTETNPNVFYELALRHAIGKPLVQIIQKGERIPFDVAGTRTIHVDHQDLDSAAAAKEAIERQIREIEADPTNIETPLSTTIDLQTLRSSGDPDDRNFAEIISEISELRSAISSYSSNDENSLSNRKMLISIGERLDYMIGDDSYLYKRSGSFPTRIDQVMRLLDGDDFDLIMTAMIGMANKFVPELVYSLERLYALMNDEGRSGVSSSRMSMEISKLTNAVVVFVLEGPSIMGGRRSSAVRETFDRFIGKLHATYM